MGLYRMFDAAYPPVQPFPGCQAVAGYIGGNTPHVWTLAEWQRFAGLVQFPIWTGYQRTNGAADGQAAAQLMHQLGWNPGSPYRRAVILDMEDEPNGAYGDGFGSAVWAAGYQTFVYEDLARLLAGGNPPKEGYLVADWTNVPSIPPYDNVVGCQYAGNVPWEGGAVDLSVITDQMLAHGGTGGRH